MINFTPKSVLEGIPYSLPPATTVVEIPEFEGEYADVLDRLADLKAEGYQLSLDGFRGRAAKPLLELVDFLKIDFLGHKLYRLEELRDMAGAYNVVQVAKRVETRKLYDLARDLEFGLFQGYYFQVPEVVPGRKLSSSQASRIRLFNLVESAEPDIEGIVDVLESDVSISYRLLTLLNSAAFSLQEPVRSVRQAVLLLGWLQLRNWLRVVILTDLSPPDKASTLPVVSVQRAMFFRLVAAQGDALENEVDDLFLLGLFSLLDAMLDLPMTAILDELPLSARVKKGLIGKEPYAVWLDLVRAYEAGEWSRVDSVIEDMGLDAVSVAKAYHRSMVSAGEYFGNGLF
jgi:EAL and modified HD-GYP domain-containing signal transduction protein